MISRFKSILFGFLPRDPNKVYDGEGNFVQISTGMLQNGAVTYQKIQDVSTTQRILARKTAGAGIIEEATLSEILDFIGSAAQGDILYRDATGWARLPAGTAGQFLKTLGSGANPNWAGAITKYDVGITVDGAGTAITAGLKGFRSLIHSGTITKVRLLADQVGNAVVDIWKDTYANFPPTSLDSITNANKPTLSAAQKYEDSTLTGWTTSVSAGDVLAFNIDSASTIMRLTVELEITVS